ncbi:hypothetical protein HID58_075436, partial [Brassica napus]
SFRYRFTVQPYIIQINATTVNTPIKENIPEIPSYIFRPQRYTHLISLASETNFLPDVVGQIRIIQRSDICNHKTNRKIIIGLLLNISIIVRLTIWDNQAANFRELQGISNRKYQVVIITSASPRLYEGTRFYFDNNIDIIQRFQKEE